MKDFSTTINNWIETTFGEGLRDLYGIFLIAAAVFALLFLIMLIVVIASNASKSGKIKRLNAQLAEAQDDGKRREEIRAELEPVIREQVENEAIQAADTALEERCNQMSMAIDDLNGIVKQKDAEIDELNAQLAEARSTGKPDADSKIFNLAQNNQDLGKENELLRERIDRLESTNARLNEQIDELNSENARLKSQPGSAASAEKSSARSTKKAAAETTAANDSQAAKASAKQSRPVEPEVDDDDDSDEYYDDYGDENSAVKVTLKFDRNKNNWIILRSDTDRTYRRLATKQEALMIAKDLARRLHAQLVVHKKDGRFQKI